MVVYPGVPDVSGHGASGAKSGGARICIVVIVGTSQPAQLSQEGDKRARIETVDQRVGKQLDFLGILFPSPLAAVLGEDFRHEAGGERVLAQLLRGVLRGQMERIGPRHPDREHQVVGEAFDDRKATLRRRCAAPAEEFDSRSDRRRAGHPDVDYQDSRLHIHLEELGSLLVAAITAQAAVEMYLGSAALVRGGARKITVIGGYR